MVPKTGAGGVGMLRVHLCKLWKDLQQFMSSLIRQGGKGVAADKQALGWRAIGIDHLVFIEHDVKIGDRVTGHLADIHTINQMLGGHQNLAFSKQQLRAVSGKQNTVLGRDQHRRTAEKAADPGHFDRGKPALAGDGLMSNPSNGLRTVIKRHNQIAGLERFDGPLSGGGQDQGAGRETGHIPKVEIMNHRVRAGAVRTHVIVAVGEGIVA